MIQWLPVGLGTSSGWVEWLVDDFITLSTGPLYSAISNVPPKVTTVPITFAWHATSLIFMCSILLNIIHQLIYMLMILCPLGINCNRKKQNRKFLFLFSYECVRVRTSDFVCDGILGISVLWLKLVLMVSIYNFTPFSTFHK